MIHPYLYSSPHYSADTAASDDRLGGVLKGLAGVAFVLAVWAGSLWAIARISNAPPPDWSSGVGAVYAEQRADPAFTRLDLRKLCGQALGAGYAAGDPDWRLLDCWADNGAASSVVHLWRDRQAAWPLRSERLAEQRGGPTVWPASG